jgi:hypothetical protein
MVSPGDTGVVVDQGHGVPPIVAALDEDLAVVRAVGETSAGGRDGVKTVQTIHYGILARPVDLAESVERHR